LRAKILNGHIFELPSGESKDATSQLSLRALVVSDISGSVVSGISIGSAKHTDSVGNIGRIVLTGRLAVTDWEKVEGFLVSIGDVTELKHLQIGGEFDGTLATSQFLINLGGERSQMIPPQKLDLRNLRLRVAHSAFKLVSRSTTAISLGDFSKVDIRHSSASRCVGSEAGVVVKLPKNDGQVWSFEDAKIYPDRQNIECRENIDLTGILVTGLSQKKG
jgi:hypothetical protein